jgi:hypothetical protein
MLVTGERFRGEEYGEGKTKYIAIMLCNANSVLRNAAGML